MATDLAAVGTLIVALALSCPLLARYLAAIHRSGTDEGSGRPTLGDRVFGPVERFVYRLLGVDGRRSQRWDAYAWSLLAFSAASIVVLFAILRLQGSLPLNPTDAGGMSPRLAFNTAVSFVTGTNWQAYSGESAMSHGGQMFGLVVTQFSAAAVGMAVALAFIRGLAQRANAGEGGGNGLIGNFWVDVVRFTIRVLLPIAVLATVVLVARGAVMNLGGFETATTVEGSAQAVPGGPVATQEVMKTLGTNGGGVLGAGSAHPFANPDGFTNLFQLYLVLLIPFSLPFLYGRLVADRRQGRAILAVMVVLWLGFTAGAMVAEQHGNDRLRELGADQGSSENQAGGNLEGKEIRLGASQSALSTVGTMGTSAGITTSALDSYTPAGGGTALGPILLGEVSPGGVGTGMVTMVVYAMLAVFIGGLVVRRTPQYLGKRLQRGLVTMLVLYVLPITIVVLGLTGAAVLLPTATAQATNPGQHGFTEIFYAYASAANGNGSAFAGLAADTVWFDTTLGIAMLVGRFLPMVVALALAGRLARERVLAASVGTMPTTGPVFVVLHLGVVLLLGGLTYLPALVLGPVGEALGG